MRRLTRWSAKVAAAVAVAAMLAACGSVGGEEVEGSGAVLDLPFDTTPRVSDAAAASERLGWDVARAVDEANVIVSPSSLSMSIALLGEGGLDDGPITSRAEGRIDGWAPGRVFILANGQQWKVLKGEVKLRQPLDAPEVTVVPGIAGRWFLEVVEDMPKGKMLVDISGVKLDK